METKHTQGEAYINTFEGVSIMVKTKRIAYCGHPRIPIPEQEANAERLAMCWNTHDSLVNMLTEIEAQYRKVWRKSPIDYDVLDKAKQLLNQLNTKP